MKLWKNADFTGHLGEYVDIDGKAIGLFPLMKDILSKNKGHLSEYNNYIYIKDTPDVEKKALDFFEKLEGRLIYRTFGQTRSAMYLWDDGIADFTYADGHSLSIRFLSQNEAMVKKTKDFFDPFFVSETQGHIYAIAEQMGELSLTSIGEAGLPLISENYVPQVRSDYKEIIADLQSSTPSGRISVITGSPGGGKTHLIKGMLMEVPDAMFVLVNPELVSKLDGPQLLPLLLAYRGALKGPIILVLEDADKCLVKRNKKNMSSVQGLLNMGDGILGSMLDIRIIATTNAKELEMDEAISRDGRLSKLIDVDVLDLETAKNIYLRLCPHDTVMPILNKVGEYQPLTLAQVYKIARKNGWKPEIRNKNKVVIKGASNKLFN